MEERLEELEVDLQRCAIVCTNCNDIFKECEKCTTHRLLLALSKEKCELLWPIYINYLEDWILHHRKYEAKSSPNSFVTWMTNNVKFDKNGKLI